MRRNRIALLGALLTVAAICVGVAVAGSDRSARPGSTAGERLPDLDIVAPGKIQVGVAVENGKRRFRLSFSSAAENVGTGPLIIVAERQSQDDPDMTATQLVERTDGSTASVENVGSLQYVTDPTHEHWHLLPFMRYELRAVKGGKLVRPDAKTGFCLGDRYGASGEARAGEFFTNCGLGDTGLLTLAEGISVGWGDNYEAWRDGQYIDVTGLAAGRYLLVHRVNDPRRIKEASYANNASSALVDLAWPRGPSARPAIKVVALCEASARCRG